MMVYLERQKQGRRIHYYLAKTIRLSNNKFKKIRQPIGSSSREYTQKEENALMKKFKPAFTKLLYETDPNNLTDFKHDTFWDKTKLFTKQDIKDFMNLKNIYTKWKKNKNIDLQYKLDEQFLIRYTYDTNRAEGNTFTLKETEKLLTKGIIDKTHKKREIYEIENTAKALNFIKDYKGELNLKFIKNIHELITKNTLFDHKNEGRLRKKGEEVTMLGNPFICPSGGQSTRILIKETLENFEINYKLNKFESIVRFYSAFISIHPFVDGNGRTSRILINWLIIREGLPPINFNSDNHNEHCDLLNDFSFNKNKTGLSDYIYDRIIERKLDLK